MESKILGSRYELIEKIGMGGMAVVYRAVDQMLGRNIAVKVLREEFKENEEFICRFKVESQAAASLSHQNIVQIYDVGEEDGIHYIVMELLEGETLKNYMNEKNGMLSFREAANFSMQICRALEHAHSKHVVHRDIKPQNIVLTEDGKIKVADFGIARAANNTTTVNSGNYAVGSAHYLSPEQARGGYTDHRSDIYSLGVVMYEMFTGKLPFDAEESISVVMKHIHEEPLRPSEVNPDIPKSIEAVIMRAMNKEQRLRYSSATEILEDLVKIYQNPAVSVMQLNAYDSEITPAAKTEQKKKTAPPKNPPQRTVRKKKNTKKSMVPMAIIISVAIIALAGILFLLKPLFMNTGDVLEIPDLTGMTYEEAALAAERASEGDIEFKVIVDKSEYSEEKKNTIISQSPEGGMKIKRSREIKVVISLGPVAIELENYVGKDYEEVEKALKKKGLKVVLEFEENDSYDEGKIFKQLPTKGTKLAEGDEVTLYVAEGAKNTYVPNVLGKKLEDAMLAIESNNLKVGKITEEESDSYEKGEVCRQSLSANTTVPEGTEIDLCISSGKKEEPQENPEDNPADKPEEKPEDVPTEKPAEKPAEPQQPQSRSVSVKLTNLSKDGPTKVRLMVDGVRVYEGDITSDSGSATIAFEADASLDISHGVDVYYDDTYRTTKEVE